MCAKWREDGNVIEASETLNATTALRTHRHAGSSHRGLQDPRTANGGYRLCLFPEGAVFPCGIHIDGFCQVCGSWHTVHPQPNKV